MAALLKTGLDLPNERDIGEDQGEKANSVDIPIEQIQAEYWAAYSVAREKLGKYNFYRNIDEPFNEECKEISFHPIGDDLADIYTDLKRLLLALCKPEISANYVLWALKFAFNNHTGRHMAGAIYALQHILLDYLVASE